MLSNCCIQLMTYRLLQSCIWKNWGNDTSNRSSSKKEKIHSISKIYKSFWHNILHKSMVYLLKLNTFTFQWRSKYKGEEVISEPVLDNSDINMLLALIFSHKQQGKEDTSSYPKNYTTKDIKPWISWSLTNKIWGDCRYDNFIFWQKRMSVWLSSEW